MQLLGYDDRERPWVVLPAVLLAVVVALVLGAATGAAATQLRRPSTAAESATSPRAEPAGDRTDACASMRQRADAVASAADAVSRALSGQTQVMTDLASGRISSAEAVTRAAPALSSGAQDSVRLDVAEQQYRAAVEACTGSR